MGQPVRLFVSHHSSKADVAAHVERTLAPFGISCWIAPRDVDPGEPFDRAVHRAIEDSVGLLLLFCSKSDQSRHVKRELILADSAGKVILPLRLEAIDPKELAYHLADSQWIDWLEQREDTIRRVAQKAHQFALKRPDTVSNSDLIETLARRPTEPAPAPSAWTAPAPLPSAAPVPTPPQPATPAQAAQPVQAYAQPAPAPRPAATPVFGAPRPASPAAAWQPPQQAAQQPPYHNPGQPRPKAQPQPQPYHNPGQPRPGGSGSFAVWLIAGVLGILIVAATLAMALEEADTGSTIDKTYDSTY